MRKEVEMLIDNKYDVVIYSKMITSNFFTILQKYFQCCMSRCCMTETEENRNAPSLNTSASFIIANNNRNPFTFDDMSNPSTPMTWTSSNSSLDSSNDPSLYLQSSSSYYKRKNIHIGIIPASYYDNSD